jgi:hypothetical protein
VLAEACLFREQALKIIGIESSVLWGPGGAEIASRRIAKVRPGTLSQTPALITRFRDELLAADVTPANQAEPVRNPRSSQVNFEGSKRQKWKPKRRTVEFALLALVVSRLTKRWAGPFWPAFSFLPTLAKRLASTLT